ncbi:hypothetical protein [Stenotrophomonas sp. YIM B06876]|uniref:DUF6933 domain-containing protein n=1 Tax=Stenotrophomonas sp. YIM B06876 TaxID=3060211 RepID=UPI00273A1FE0|nr:hypothetical protein [Stenotrophomonas sp. YIM B06876]
MTVLRCTAKLLKRLKLPAKPPEPEPQANPLGEWYADIDFWRRQPFVVLLNAATGAVLVLPGNAAGLRRLHESALLQFAGICHHHGLHGQGVEAELAGFHAGFTYAATRDRSLLASLNQRKFAFWLDLEHSDRSLPEVAAHDWEGLFKHPALGRNTRHNMDWHMPLNLLRQRLLPAAQVIPFPSSPSTTPSSQA